MSDSFETFVALRPKNYDNDSWHNYEEAEIKTLSAVIPLMTDQLATLLTSKTWQQGSDSLVPYYSLLSLRGCVAEYQCQLELDKEELAFEPDDGCLMHRGYLKIHAKPDGAIKIDRRWRPNWIPLTAGEQMGHFIDFDPGENGKQGQVVRFNSSSFAVDVVGNSLDDWFNRLSTLAKTADAGQDEFLFELPAITETI